MDKIGFRVDGGGKIGFGHFMRMRTLAEEFKNRGFHLIFITQSDFIVDQLKEEFSVVELPKSLMEMEGTVEKLKIEAQWLKKLIADFKIGMLIIDSYQVSNEYFQILKTHLKCLVYFEDWNKQYEAVDIIINGNLYAQYDQVRNRNIYEPQSHKVYITGTEYLILRKEFKDLSVAQARKRIKHIVLTTGGSDPYGVTMKLLRLLEKHIDPSNQFIHILVNKQFRDMEALINEAKKNDYIMLYTTFEDSVIHSVINHTSVSELMRIADLGICAGGVTPYEFMTMGVPVMAFIMAENQMLGVSTLAQSGYIMSLGHYQDLVQNFENAWVQMNSFDYRQALIDAGHQLVDANGCERVVSVLEEWLIQNES